MTLEWFVVLHLLGSFAVPLFARIVQLSNSGNLHCGRSKANVVVIHTTVCSVPLSSALIGSDIYGCQEVVKRVVCMCLFVCMNFDFTELWHPRLEASWICCLELQFCLRICSRRRQGHSRSTHS